MAKYTCNYDVLNDTSTRLANAVDAITASVDTYNTAIDTSLAGWSGTTKDKFVEAKDENVTAIKEKLEKGRILSEYIFQVSSLIAETDTDLTQLKL